MQPEDIKAILQQTAKGSLKVEDALKKLKDLPFENLDFARIDHHRTLRSGIPEVVYCQSKTPQQIQSILKSLIKSGADVLATRLGEDVYKKIRKHLPAKARYHEAARVLVIQKRKKKPEGNVCVVTAGTSDIPVAEEAAVTLETFGSRVTRINDVGVAGLHRLLNRLDTLRESRVVLAVAGMEGALVSVLGGLLEQPVIGVPTSVGYGTAFGGVAPLLTMLNSCSTGIGVVNIDNGFGAACLAHKINRLGAP
ncbi:MAG: nickel pincer cofactor biosynthesis protein LarB [Nitrospina sp.]|nr:nickel pincer cofactor biosynthesis protein LarB [Nitrospina sp.]